MTTMGCRIEPSGSSVARRRSLARESSSPSTRRVTKNRMWALSSSGSFSEFMRSIE